MRTIDPTTVGAAGDRLVGDAVDTPPAARRWADHAGRRGLAASAEYRHVVGAGTR